VHPKLGRELREDAVRRGREQALGRARSVVALPDDGVATEIRAGPSGGAPRGRSCSTVTKRLASAT
jgi:hypothetical protein